MIRLAPSPAAARRRSRQAAATASRGSTAGQGRDILESPAGTTQDRRCARSLALIELLILATSLTMGAADSKEDLPREVFRHWIHSHEEDSEGLQVYRPDSFQFPRARGRSALEIRPDGTFILERIAARDGREKLPGRWTLLRRNTISIRLDDPQAEPFTITVVSCDAGVLRIRSQPGSLSSRRRHPSPWLAAPPPPSASSNNGSPSTKGNSLPRSAHPP